MIFASALLVFQAPFLEDGGCFLRQSPLADLPGPNFDEGFETLVLDMDVRRRRIVMPHAHDDAKENGEDRHGVPIRGDP